MSIAQRLAPAEVASQFTHRGWFLFVPVWVHVATGDLAERNWVPEIALHLALLLFGLFCEISQLFDPLWEPKGFPIYLTGRVADEGR